MELDLATAAYCGAVLLLAYMVRGVAGFGSGLISVPLLALVFPLPLVVPVVVFLDYVGSASQGLKNRSEIVWREQLPLIPFTLIGVGIGLTLLDSLSPDILARALGGFVIVYAVYQLLPLPPLRGTRLYAAPCGSLGGLIGTLFGTGGPLYVIYFGLRGLGKTGLRATIAINFLIDGGIRLAGYAVFGFLNQNVITAAAMALPVAAIGLWLGGRIHSSMSPASYARVISVLLLGSGIMLFLKG